MTEKDAHERRAEEYVKLCFEIFKHLTTLSTAGALVVLAVYREISIETWLVTLTLILFGLTVLTCVMSMTLAAGYFADTSTRASERQLMWLLTVVSATFTLAVVLFTFLPLELPQWTALILALVLVFVGVMLLRALLRGQFARTVRAYIDSEPEKDD
jgi:predicted cobalt transporter CbtA